MQRNAKEIKWRLQPTTTWRDVAPAWDRINRTAYDSPLLQSEMVELLLRHFGSGRERLYVGRRADEIVALAWLERRNAVSWQTFQPAQAPLGGIAQLRDLPIEETARTLLDALPPWALLLGLTQQDPDLAPRPSQESAIESLDYIETARVTIDGSFEDYWQARGSNLKQNLRKQRNRLAREGVVTRIEIVADPVQITSAVDDYGRMESAGWKGAEGTALHPDNVQGRFYRELLSSYARRGAAEAVRYFFNDRLVATDLCVTGGGQYVILKTTHAEAGSNLSPTMLMRQELFERLFAERKYRAIEFYGKLMEWHTRWSSEVRRMYHVNVYRWPGIKRLRELGRRRNLPAVAPGTTGQS